MKDEFDNMIQRTFESADPNARFEFREAYWKQAKVLLEEDERRRRGIVLFRTVLGAALLICALGGIWYWNVQNNTPTAAPTQLPIAQTETPAHEGGEGTSLRASTTLQAVEPATATQTPSGPSQPNLIQNQFDLALQNQANTSANANPSNVVAPLGSGQPTPKGLVQSSNNSVAEPQASVSQQPTNISSQTTNNSIVDPQASFNSQILSDGFKINDLAVSAPTEIEISNTSIQAFDLFQAIALRYPTLNTQDKSERLVLDPSPIAPTKKSETDLVGKLQFGLVGVGSFSTSVAPRFSGFAGGVAARYRFKPNWEFSSDLLLSRQFLNRDSQAVISVIDNRYSFGYTKTATNSYITDRYKISLPLGVAFVQRRWAAELGIAPNIVIGERQEYEVFESNSLQLADALVDAGAQTRLNRQFKVFSTNFWGGVSFRFNHHWSIRGQIRYAPIRFKESIEYQTTKYAKNHLDVQLRYFF